MDLPQNPSTYQLLPRPVTPTKLTYLCSVLDCFFGLLGYEDKKRDDTVFKGGEK
jgi:hypothetical protein